MTRIITTNAEIVAYQLLLMAGEIGNDTNISQGEINEAGNRIIQLAEKIKAERAVSTMNKT